MRLYERGSLPDDPRAWLVTVAHNQLRDAHRRRTRRAALLEREATAVEPEGSPPPDADVAARERRERVRQALASLPERDRRALLMRHEGYAYREIAVALDYAPSGVGKLLVRASRAFERAIVEGGVDAPPA